MAPVEAGNEEDEAATSGLGELVLVDDETEEFRLLWQGSCHITPSGFCACLIISDLQHGNSAKNLIDTCFDVARRTRKINCLGHTA
jgi:hypothetical protein